MGEAAKRPADLLKGILREAKAVAGRAEFQRALEVSVGPDQAEHCRVMGFRSGRLVVEVDSAPLYAELCAFRGEQIRLAMNEKLQREKIARVTFRMGGTGHV